MVAPPLSRPPPPSIPRCYIVKCRGFSTRYSRLANPLLRTAFNWTVVAEQQRCWNVHAHYIEFSLVNKEDLYRFSDSLFFGGLLVARRENGA